MNLTQVHVGRLFQRGLSLVLVLFVASHAYAQYACSDLFQDANQSFAKVLGASEKRAQHIFNEMQSLTKNGGFHSDLDLIELYQQSIAAGLGPISQFLQDRSNYPQEMLNSKTAMDASRMTTQLNDDLAKLSRFTSKEKSLTAKISGALDRRSIDTMVTDVRHANWTLQEKLRYIATENQLLRDKGEELINLITALDLEVEFTRSLTELLQNEAFNNTAKTQEAKAMDEEVMRQIAKTASDMSEIMKVSKALVFRIDESISNNSKAVSELRSTIAKQIALVAATSGQNLDLSPRENSKVQAAKVNTEPSLLAKLNFRLAKAKATSAKLGNFVKYNTSFIILSAVFSTAIGGAGDLLFKELYTFDHWQDTTQNFHNLDDKALAHHLQLANHDVFFSSGELQDIKDIAGPQYPVQQVGEFFLNVEHRVASAHRFQNDRGYEVSQDLTKRYYMHAPSEISQSDVDNKALFSEIANYRDYSTDSESMAWSEMNKVMDSYDVFEKFQKVHDISLTHCIMATLELESTYRGLDARSYFVQVAFYNKVDALDALKILDPIFRNDNKTESVAQTLKAILYFSTGHADDFSVFPDMAGKSFSFQEVVNAAHEAQLQGISGQGMHEALEKKFLGKK